MNKKIAVIIYHRQAEALRMSIGLTLADDKVDIFFIDDIQPQSADFDLNISTGKELGINMYSTCEESDTLQKIGAHLLAKRLLEYDHILPY